MRRRRRSRTRRGVDRWGEMAARAPRWPGPEYATGQLLDDDPRFGPGEQRAEAHVGAEAEGEVIAGVGSSTVEHVGVVERCWVAVGSADGDEDVGVSGHGDAAQFDRSLGEATPVDHRRVVAQHLFDRVGDQRGLGAQGLPAFRLLEELAQALPSRVVVVSWPASSNPNRIVATSCWLSGAPVTSERGRGRT
jgi:hypothetical protein